MIHTNKRTRVYGRGPFKQEYIPAANRIGRQIRVQLHYFIFSFLGRTPIRKRLPVKFTKFQFTNQLLHRHTHTHTNCYSKDTFRHFHLP
jgi:hypothetical protein